MGVWRQTLSLVWKNFQIKRRNKKETLQEIIIPVYWLLILVGVRLGIKTTPLPAVKTSEIPKSDVINLGSETPFGLNSSQIPSTKPIIGVVTHNDSQAGSIVQLLEQHSNQTVVYKRFNSSESMLSFYRTNGESSLGAGVIFTRGSSGVLEYTLRVPIGNIPDIKSKLTGLDKCHKRFFDPFQCPASKYLIYNTTTLQASIDAAISKVVANLPFYIVPNITVQMMPKAQFTPSLQGIQTIVPIYMVLAFSPYITILVINLVREKQEKHKELMRIMGMVDTAYWLSWFLTYAIVVLIACLIMVTVSVIAGFFGESNYLVLLIVFYLYGLSIIMLSFMMSPLFKNPKTAGFIASLFTAIFAVLIIPLTGPSIPQYAKWLVSIFSPTAFAFALNEAVEVHPGAQFSNLATKGDFPVLNCIVMLIVDILLYLLIALYLDAVVPAEYGRRQPPYFIFQPSFWKTMFQRGGGSLEAHGVRRQLSAHEVYSSEDVEPVAQEMHGREAISIHNLKKVFPGKKPTVAVDGISMDIYEGQITALLGHNGAGKSTLIGALTGMIQPSSGTALIYGKDISRFGDLAELRRNIGVCPQQDVIFEFLTVKEHLEFYFKLKTGGDSQQNNGADAILKEIGLQEKKDDIAKNLSGGQKRKLSVGISLVGDPKVLFLDEPTSGMDPHSRREMWKLLQGQCKEKCVLLTTHFMDEADILADYKAILSKGKLRCAGTSLFLKNRFGIGYHLNTALSDDCDTDRLKSFVEQHVPGADVIRHHGYEMAFSLPLEEVAHFSGLFAALENNNAGELGASAKDLGVTSYGVSMTTLEEVFLRLEDTSDEESQEKTLDHVDFSGPQATGNGSLILADSRDSGINAGAPELNAPEISADKATRGTWYKQQVAGLLKIRWLNTIRSPLKVIFTIIVPPILLIVGIVLLRNRKLEPQADTIRFPLSPSYCLSHASQESFASALLFQNSTSSNVDNILGFLKDYDVSVDQVNNLEGYLNISSAKPRCLGIDVQQFPTATNVSFSKFEDLLSSYLVRYNDTTQHSIPVATNLLGSLFNMYALAAQNMSLYPIKTTLQPLPSLGSKWTYDASSFTAMLLIGMAFAIIPGGLGIEVVSYRQNRIRHLFRVSGLSQLMYWFHFLSADFLVFLIPALIMLIVIPAAQVVSLAPAGAMGCLVIAALLYIPAVILLAYICSFAFNNWETAQQVLPTVFNLLGIGPFIAISLVDMLGNQDSAIIAHYVMVCLNPCYGIFGALYYINRIFLFASVAAQSNDVDIKASVYFTWTKHNGIPAVFIAHVFHLLLLPLLVYYLDSRDTGSVVKNPCKCPENRSKVDLGRMTSFQSDEPEDDDVMAEKERLLGNDFGRQGNNTEYTATVKGLWKKFGRGKKGKVVVKDVYFGVTPGEVFGLLGPNGAGKTTTLNMMTAGIPASRGSVSVAGYDLQTETHKVFQHMGFCPQQDALFDDITLEEHLTLYASVRGVPWASIDNVVNHYMSAMKITEHANKRAKELSGGTKRKLSFGMAMLGDPDLLLLDEPSTGMDPSARRFLWNVISKNVTGARGAILTTHSMEEADALCSRVGIMVKGQLKCLGSTQHLKSKFGSGYTLEIKLSPSFQSSDPDVDMQTQLVAFVEGLFPNAKRTESFGDRVIYKVPKSNVSKLSSTFATLEEGKRSIGIEEYSFSQSTLEQVFLEFAREQDDDRTGAKDLNSTEPPQEHRTRTEVEHV